MFKTMTICVVINLVMLVAGLVYIASSSHWFHHLVWRTTNCEGDSMWLWPAVALPVAFCLGAAVTWGLTRRSKI